MHRKGLSAKNLTKPPGNFQIKCKKVDWLEVWLNKFTAGSITEPKLYSSLAPNLPLVMFSLFLSLAIHPVEVIMGP